MVSQNLKCLKLTTLCNVNKAFKTIKYYIAVIKFESSNLKVLPQPLNSMDVISYMVSLLW